MKAVHLKMGLTLHRRTKSWRTACCHVRTATIFYGVFHLMIYMLTLAVFLLNDRVFLGVNEMNPFIFDDPEISDVAPPPSSDVNQQVDFKIDTGATNSLLTQIAYATAQNMFKCEKTVGVVATLSACAITLLFIYGAVRGKSGCLIPFFCFQVFDFLVESFFVMGYICSYPMMEMIVAKSVANRAQDPFSDNVTPRAVTMITMTILLSFIAALFVKAYFIHVIWNCYQFLILRQTSALRTVNCIEPPIDNQSLLPNYAASVTKYFPPPPPDYATAVAQDFPANISHPSMMHPQVPQTHPVVANSQGIRSL